MDFVIFCRVCNGEQAAAKRRGPLPGSRRCTFAIWWNVCLKCGTHYAALPPVAERVRRRCLERASGQLRLIN